MMIYYGRLIEKNGLREDSEYVPQAELLAAYQRAENVPPHIREAFSLDDMKNEKLYQRALTNSDKQNVYVYILKYRLKEQQSNMFIVSEYLEALEEKMQYEQALWYENTRTLGVFSALLVVGAILIFISLYYLLIRPIRTMSVWLSNPSDPIPYDRIKYQELINVVHSYQSSLEKQTEIIEKEELFLSTMSHELRTPIAIIASSVELLDRLEVEERVAKINGRISYAITNMNYLVKTLLWLSRKNNQPLTEEVLDLSALIHQVIDDNHYLLEGRDTVVEVKCTLEPNYEIRDNYGAIHLAIVNLVRNALQYSADGQIDIIFDDGVLMVKNPYQENINQTKGKESYGYGLYLVEKICASRGYLFSIDYQSDSVVASLSVKT
ncbi:HAMP domain-containing sensor histidine kinase [Vibrio fortis]|uniref:HAMP domain-containing sensor histidine kinase n=1 Tax=Vibrio fortis TaxID=212667 RepID=UPI002F3E1F29